MILDRVYPAALLSPDERVDALRLATRALLEGRHFDGTRLRMLAAYASPNAKPNYGETLVTVVVGRTLRDEAMLLPPVPAPHQSIARLSPRVMLRFIDTEALFRTCRFSAGHPALGEELVSNEALNQAFDALAAASGVTPAALATVVDAAAFSDGLAVRCRSRLSLRWNRMGEAVLTGALLGEVDAEQGLPFGEGTAQTLARAAVERLRALDDPGLGRDVHDWLVARLAHPSFAVGMVAMAVPAVLPQAALEHRVAALEQITEFPDLVPELARSAVVVATGGTRPIRPSMRGLVLAQLNPQPQQQPGADEPEEFLL